MIFQPRDLLKQYEKLDKDPLLFMHWMKKQCQANIGHAKKTFDVVKGLNSGDKFISKDKEAPKKNLSAPASSLLTKNLQATPKSPIVISSQTTSFSTAPECKAVVGINNPKIITGSHNDQNDGKDGVNQHLLKLRKQFTTMHDTANKKMLDLQLELAKMQHMSHEFDVLAEFLSSEEKLSTFEQNLDRLQKTVRLTEDKLQAININNHKMVQVIDETTKMQYNSNKKAINEISERLIRWESKLDRVAKKISNQKIDVNELKLNGDYGKLKDDIEGMLNGRLDDISTNMNWMKNVIFCIISLIILKTVLFDVIKKGDASATT